MNKQNSSQLASSQQKKKIMTLQNDFDYKYSRDIQIATNNQTPGELYKKVVQQKLNQYFDRVDQSEKAYSNNMNQHKNEQPVMKNISYLQAREDHKKLKKDSNHKNEKYYAQNQYSQKKNTKQSQQYNVYDIKNYEYGEYSPQSDSQNWQQKQRQPNINQENQEYKQQMNESEYQEKYLDYPQNVYLKQQYQNKPQIQNKKQTPNADLRYQRNYQQADGYENERGQFRNKQDSRQQQLYHDDSQDYQNKINAFHKENLHQHSQKKLKSMEQTQDQALDGIYEKYYKKKDNYFDVSPYSQRYNPKGSDQQYYDNDKSQNSQNKQENSECELSYEDILYEGNQSFEEGRQSQSRSNKKMDFGNNSQQANQFWNMRKHLHSRDNSNNKKSNNQDNSYLQNSYNDTKSKGILSKSNFIDYDNNNEQQNQDRSRSQSQHDYQHPQTHRDQKQNNLEYNYYERSNSIDRSYQDKPIRQRLQFEGTEKSLQREIKKNNYFQEGSQSRDNSQIFEQSQQIKKQPLKQNQQIMHEYNLTDQSNQSIGFQKQIQFEQNSQRNNKEKLLNDSQHFSSNLQQQYQQNQQQLFINQLIQNAHSAHQSLELDLQKISEENTLRKMMQQNRSQSNINQLQQNNLQQVQSIQQNNKLQSQPIQADVNIIISQQNLLIQNLIQQLLQVQAQQMVNTINKSHANQQSLLGVNNFNLSQSDLLKNQTGQGSSSNMQQINYLLQQQMNLKKSQNLLDSNLLQLINPINQQLLLNLLQAQEQFDQTNQSLKLNQQLNAQNLSEDILQGSLPRSLSNTQILNLQDNQLIQSPAKLVEDKLKDISEKQDNMSRRLVQILDYSKNKLNSSLSQKQIQSSQGLSNQNQVAEKNQNTLNDQYGNSTKQQQKNEQKNFPRSKSQLNVYDNSNQEVKDQNNKQSFQNFSKIMDDIIYKQEVTIKNLQRERKLSKIAKEQQENSQNSIQQTSADEIVSKELSEIQHYIKNVQNSCNQIDTNKPKTKSTKELMQNMKHLNDALEKEQKGNHQMAYSIHAQPNHHEQNNHTTSGISKPNTQRKRWGDDSTYNSSKQQHLNLNEVETPQGMINFRNEEQEEIEDIKHRFKQDFKKYLEKSNSKNIPPSKKEYSPSNKQKQIQKEENSDFTEQVKPNYSNGSQTQQTIRSPKRWDIPLNKQSDQNKYQKSETSEFQESYQLSKQPQEKKSPQQWTINWDDENQEDPTNSQKQTQSNLKKNYSRKELQANTSPFANNSNLQPKQALNNIFEQKNEAQNQKGRSLSSHQKDDREQIKKQYQQYKPPTFQHQESFKPQGENHNEFKDTNYQNNNQANAYNIVFDGDNIDDVSKSKQSLADIFKNRKQELLDKLEDQRKKKVRDHSQQPSKTKEELAQIRKELLQQTRRRDLSANNNNMRQNQASMSRGRQNSNNLDMSFEFKNDQKNKSIKDPPPELLNRLIYGLKAKVDKKDYKKLTMKNYELLPEIKKKKEEEKKRQEMAERIKHKKEYEQKLRQRMKNSSNLNKSQMQSSQIQSYNQLQYNQNYQQQQDQQLYQYQNYI